MTKLLFVVTEDWYFCSHRLSLAKSIKKTGFEVVVATRISACEEQITAAGIRITKLKQLKRSSLNPIQEWLAFWELLSVFRNERPDIVHNVALKPVIYGSFAAKILGVPAVVNAIAGMGFIFSSKKKLAFFLKPLMTLFFRFIFNSPNSRLILQNLDDFNFMEKIAHVHGKNLRLIPGAGVDIENYIKVEMSKSDPIAMLASRMIWDKGIGEFVNAARALKTAGCDARFVLVGAPDGENPLSITENELRKWQQEGVIEWWGHCMDMPTVLSKARVFCLPTYYGEGVPKVLLEAMAVERPIITTEMPGCRDLVKANSNGFLVPPRDVNELSKKLHYLLNDVALCIKMGKEGRKIVEKEHTTAHVTKRTLKIYDELLKK